MKSLKRARRVTSEFHRIQRELEEVVNVSKEGVKEQGASSAIREKQRKLTRELQAIGGRQAYQEASVLTTGRHRTCKWIFAIMTKLGLRPAKNQRPLKLLEVGAVNTQLLSVPWLDVRAIDIKVSATQTTTIPQADENPSCAAGTASAHRAD